ncbi:phosphopantothenoylcysteine decarboxylase/phosphopantothenate--cysteine ligase [Nakamurella sp. UYEF19]|uniref:flavoprotein n=1 Tax=Nakamurella sp. UYEF19 TaxID=1756392 RepID=UPI0033981762
MRTAAGQGPGTTAAAGAASAPLGIDRLLWLVTGSVAAADVPFLVRWVRLGHPGLQLKVVLTRSARRFVTPEAVASRLGAEPESDVWAETGSQTPHVDWAQWAQAVLVYPATFGVVARLALGLADSPAVLAAHCSGGPLVIAPALPPGGLESAVLQEHWQKLADRPGVALAPCRRGESAADATATAWAPAPFPEALELLRELAADPTGRSLAQRSTSEVAA